MLVEAALREQYVRAADAAGPTPSPSATADLRALERIVLDVVDVAQEHEHVTTAMEKAATEADKAAGREVRPRSARDNPVNALMREREAALVYAAEQYEAELEQWEKIEADLPKLAAGEEQAILPAVPQAADLVGVPDASDLVAPAVKAFESYVLHQDDINHKLKVLEQSQSDAEHIAVAIADTLNAHAFDGIFDINCASVVAAPSPAPSLVAPRSSL
jgi:hypothetical protein